MNFLQHTNNIINIPEIIVFGFVIPMILTVVYLAESPSSGRYKNLTRKEAEIKSYSVIRGWLLGILIGFVIGFWSDTKNICISK